MTREILFRGKRIDNGEWVVGGVVQGVVHELWRNSDRAYITVFPEFLSRLKLVEVDPNTVGQYTGLTANGKKIFEGDILRLDYIGVNAFIVFDKGKFGVLRGWHKKFVPLDVLANTTLEVIGNIHDNPELLEE